MEAIRKQWIFVVGPGNPNFCKICQQCQSNSPWTSVCVTEFFLGL